MTTLTIVTALLMFYGLRGRRQYIRALALSGSTAAGAAISLGGIAVPTFYAVAVAASIVVVHDALRRSSDRERQRAGKIPGFPLLFAFFGWSLVVTLAAPILFDGQPVVVPADSHAQLHAGHLTSSNIAQIVYLALAVAVVIYIARTPGVGPEIIGTVVMVTISLSAWRYASIYYGAWFPERFFDNSDQFTFIETSPQGEDRFRGILSEPAALAGIAVIAMCYSASRIWQVCGIRRAGLIVLFTVSLYLGLVSTSTTFIVAGVAMVIIGSLTFIVRFVFRGSAVSALSGFMTSILVILAIWIVPIISGFVEAQVEDKVGTASYEDRSSADSDSYDVLIDTFGIGVGLGSNRPSSFVPGLLGSTGVPGTLLFAGVIVGALVRNGGNPQVRPAVWALVTSLVLKGISGPDISDASGLLWLCLGLLAQKRPVASISRGYPLASVERRQ